MEPLGSVVVITGAAGGIGRALARRLHAEGAEAVVVADVDGESIAAVAAELDAIRPGSALGVTADVTTGEGNESLVRASIARFGRVDLFWANAGIALGTSLETPMADWRQAFAVNIEAHVHAAELLVPGWVERGSGCFCVTASAAGLLTQIGSWPYSVTKHAAVAFAEWLSITYGGSGLEVHCLCPMGVNTAMLNPPAGVQGVDRSAGDVVRAAGAVLEPDAVAEIAVAGLREGGFLILPHPEVLTFWQRKTADYDRWIAGMRRLQATVTGR